MIKNSIGYMMGLGVCLALPLVGLTSGDCSKIGAACSAEPVSLKAAACGAETVSGVAEASECSGEKASACGAQPVSLTAAACGAEPVSGVAEASECSGEKASACGAQPVSLTAAACGAEPVSGVAEGDACTLGEGSKKLAVAQYKVKGMSCGACEGKLTGELQKVAGVSEPKACAESGIAKLSYDAEKVKKEDLIAAIQRAGYTVDAEVVELKVEGAHCSGCTGEITKALDATKGVKAHKVSHEDKLAVVTFDPAKTCVDSVVAAIGRSGFEAVQ